jgi:hypothetical protein
MATEEIGNLIGTLFFSRELAHREHLTTSSYAQHMALGDFYEEVIGLADRLAEAYQGEKQEKIKKIPYYSNESSEDIVSTLKKILGIVQKKRKDVCPDNSSIQAIIDDVEELFFSTIYKLTFLK